MPTLVSESDRVERKLWTATDFLEWLKPGVHADLIYGEHGVQEYWILDPDTRAHRFYHRQGEELVEFAAGEPVIRAHAISGFWVRREWFNADPLPEVAPCLEQVLAAHS